MSEFDLKSAVQQEIIRAALERVQSSIPEKAAAPKTEDAAVCAPVEEILNIPYVSREEVPLGMDIFKPVVPAGTALPVIVAVHGGGLTAGDRAIARPFARLLAGRGYLVFSIEYRLSPRVDLRARIADVCAGMELVSRRLADFDVDRSRVFLTAESIGAYPGMYAAAMASSLKLQEVVGCEPADIRFQAVGVMSGVFYNGFQDLSDQRCGTEQMDEELRQYMDPEHSEVLRELPPVYLVTSRGDGLNRDSIRMNEALNRAGKLCHIAYYGDQDLQHAFPVLQAGDPRSGRAVDKMLAWFEEQAAANAEKEKNAKAMSAKRRRYETSRDEGRKDRQRISQYIRECVSVYPERRSAPAILDCTRTYTYAQMFEQWDKYARVFTALGMTEANGARVAIVGTISAEPIFAYYGLNTVGACVSMFSYPDLLPGGRWRTMVEKEHITDMVISDLMVTPQMWAELEKARKEFGLKNIILLHTRMGGPSLGYAEMLYDEFNYQALRRIPGVVFMNDLIEKYADVEIACARKSGSHIAVICHTSGTANGTRKPLPYTDSIINGMNRNTEERPMLDDVDGGARKSRAALPFDFSSSMSINGLINGSFVQGGSVVLTVFGFMHPRFIYAFRYYNVTSSFTSGFMLEKWMQIPALDKEAFASVKVFGLGGSYVSPEKYERYEKFLKAHGFTGELIQGYGMSELGGLGLNVPKGCREDILGYPGDVEAFRVLDENDGKFYKTDQGVRTGILYGTSPTMSLNVLDGEKLFELTEIDGKNFICTNDSVRVNEDGSLSYAGRANRYFTNNEGVRFEAGAAETVLSADPRIKMCTFVPVLEKRIHDTVPVLYAVPAGNKSSAAEDVRSALEDAFVNSEQLKGSALPTQFILVDTIPCNSNGKVDVYHITRSRLKGSAYNILPVRDGERLVGIRMEPAAQITSITGGTLPEGMGKDSAFGVFELFNEPAQLAKAKKYRKWIAEKGKTIRAYRDDRKGKLMDVLPARPADDTGMPKVPAAVRNAVMGLGGFMFDQAMIDHDFEE